jgi:flagellar FliL protein
MGRKKKAGAEGGGGDGKKSNLLPAVIVAIGLVLGGKFMGGGGGGAAAPAAAADATTTTSTTVPGPVVKLDAITLNLSDGHFLRVGFGFQLSAEHGGGGHGAKPDTSDAAGTYARALDLAIEVLGGGGYAELVTPAGREHAKEELLHKLEAAYPHQIEDVYFTEFVLQ